MTETSSPKSLNYAQKRALVAELLGPVLRSQFPEVSGLVDEFAARLVNQREANRNPIGSNPAFVNFGHAVSSWNPSAWIRFGLYRLLSEKPDLQGERILTSVFLHRRFPHLIREIGKRSPVVFAVTSPTAPVAYRAKLSPVLKFDDIFYSRRSSAVLRELVARMSAAARTRRPLDLEPIYGDIKWLESWLLERVLRTSERLKKNEITQYISAFSNRYEDYFLARGCAYLSIPSKEVCHGLNAHRLEESDNTVPVHARLFYAWNEDYRQNIGAYEHPERILCVGYPKYTAEAVRSLRSRYPRRKVITFFSQATYDIGSPVDLPLSAELFSLEADFRKQLFAMLSNLKDSRGYEVRVRYHPGEIGHDTKLRAREREKLKVCGFIESRNHFDQDLFESEIAVGINTSCLYESFLIGNKAIQLRFGPTKSAYYREIPVVEIEQLPMAIDSLPLSEPKFERTIDVKRLLEIS